MDTELKELLTEKNETIRNIKIKSYTIKQNAQTIARNRFADDIKYIYANCDSSTDDNFNYIVETLDFNRPLELNQYNKNMNSAAIAEIIDNKDYKIDFMGELISRLKDLDLHSTDFIYNELIIFMFVQIATKQDMIYLYSAIIAYFDKDKIKHIQQHAILA